MDNLINEFTVQRPIDEAWAILTDLERIAPCMPGAQLQEIDGDEYRGIVKIKLGAIQANFKGQATFVERDDAEHRAVLNASGRDTGGKGNANAVITATLTEVAGATTCRVETELRIIGKIAQFGRSIMGDVSKKLMAQFADNLNAMLAEETSAAAPSPAGASPDSADVETADVETAGAEAPSAAASTAGTSAAAASTGDAGTAPAAAAAATDARPAPRRIDGPAAEPIELSNVAGAAVAKRAVPVLVAVIVALCLLRRRRRRRRRNG